jgi:formylmethanofuran dehydrogenase subunit C
MTGWRLELRQAPALRVDLRGIVPDGLAALSISQIEQLRVGCGNTTVPLAEFFRVAPSPDEELRFAGDLARFDRIGWQMRGGTLVVEGDAGHYVGAAMSGGELRVHGSAGLHAACEMAGGHLSVAGTVGDFAAGNLPGSMDGMRGGTLVVRGRAGARFGDRMRRGTALVFGDAGEFLGARMVAGTIAIGGRAGPHAGYAMRRGSLVFAGPAPTLPPTFVPAIAAADVIWQLLARDLARHGGVFAELPARRIERHLGDLAADGKGELIAAS